jgi:hypothetical protein
MPGPYQEMIERRHKLVKDIKNSGDTLFAVRMPVKTDRRRWRFYSIYRDEISNGGNGKLVLDNVTNNIARLCKFKLDENRWCLVGGILNNDASDVREAIRDQLGKLTPTDDQEFNAWVVRMIDTFEFTHDHSEVWV